MPTLTVYRQAAPIETTEVYYKVQSSGEFKQESWYRPNLVEVGKARNWEEAKRLTPYPVVSVE